jgi:hypothetical protein
MRRIQVHFKRRRKQIAGLLRPLLALAPVGRQFQRAPVGEVKSFIAIEYRLNKIIAAGNRRKMRGRPTERIVVQHGDGTGRQTLDVETE